MRESLVNGASVERLLLLNAALRSGLIDALDREGAWSAAEIASTAGANLRAVQMVLEALVAEGVVDRVTAETYRLSNLGRAHLVEKGPNFERSGILHLAGRVANWLTLSETIRVGKPSEANSVKRDLRSFVSAMGERPSVVLEEIVEVCLSYAGQINTMIDLGGAVGHIARQFSRSGVLSTLFDKPGVIPIAREYLGEEAVDITLLGGDFLESLPSESFDLVYLGNISHIYGPQTNLQLMSAIAGILPPGGTIAIQDLVWGRSARAPMFAVNMLQSTEDGGVWSEEQYRDWLKRTGYSAIEVFDLETTGSQLILGRKL